MEIKYFKNDRKTSIIKDIGLKDARSLIEKRSLNSRNFTSYFRSKVKSIVYKEYIGNIN